MLDWSHRISRVGRSLQQSGLLLWILPLAAGAYLRVYLLGEQIVADDEWHPLSQVLHHSYSQIAETFGGADHCVPLSLFYEWAANWIGLSEWVMRFPVLLAGLATIVLMPALTQDILGKQVAYAYSWVLAVNPMLVFYSRYARPYSFAVLLSLVAALGFYKWWKGGPRRWAVVFLFASILCPWFHLTTMPFVLALMGFSALTALTGRLRGEPKPGQILRLVLLVFGGWLVLLGPPLLFHPDVVLGRIGRGTPDLETAAGALFLLLGSKHVGVIILMLFLGFVGVAACWRLRKDLVGLLGLLAGAQIVCIWIFSPEAVGVPIVLARYLLPVLPAVLLLVAAGAVRLLRLKPVAPLLGGLLVVSGPLPEIYYSPNNWTNHGLFQYAYDRLEAPHSYQKHLQPKEIPEFYRWLGRQPAGTLRVLEAPWYLEWLNNHYPYLQRTHRQWMTVGFVGDPAGVQPSELPMNDPRFDFRLFVHVADLQRVRERGVRFVIFHKDLSSEIPNSYPRKGLDVSRWIQSYRKRVGPPLAEDGRIVVFDLSLENSGKEP